MSKLFQSLILFIAVIFFAIGTNLAENKEKKIKKVNSLSKTNGTPSRIQLNINNISTWFENNGDSDISPSGNSGFVFPKGSGKTAVFESGLIWGATLNGERRVGGSTYNQGLLPGRIIGSGVAAVREDESLEHVRIYRVRRNLMDIFAEINDGEGSEGEIIAQYEKDWNEWPAQYGAPYEDIDGDGNYNPTVDIPGVKGADQTIWYVANDLDTTVCQGAYGSNPMGIEMQTTVWGYNQSNYMGNIIFRKYKIINKSVDVFNEMYVSMWADPDIGGAGDDYSGCDTTLSLMYSYNSDAHDDMYGKTPPAVGFDFFQGPLVPGEVTDTAVINNQKRPGFKNLPMSVHYFFISGDAVYGDPNLGDYVNGTLQFHNLFRGRISTTGEPFIDPTTGNQAKFTLSGDPVTGNGWIDGLIHPPGDRRQGMVAGPFTMAVGDTQEVVIAEIAAFGEDRLDAITKLKQTDYYSQEMYNSFFDFETTLTPPSVTVSFVEENSDVTLTWEQSSEIESFNNDSYQFQGYNIYQLPEGKKIKTFDKIDGITTISQLVYDPELGYETMQEVRSGTDSGLEYEFKIEKDYINDSKLLIGKPYSFGITSYTYSSDNSKKIKTSESRISVIELIYGDSEEGIKYGDILEVEHLVGISDGVIKITVIDRTELTGNDYEVFFTQQNYYLDSDDLWKETTDSDSTNSVRTENHWNVKNMTTGNVVLEKQRVFGGIDIYYLYWDVPKEVHEDTAPIVDGFRIAVSGNFDVPDGMFSYHYNGDGSLPFTSGNSTIDMSDYGMHGWAATGRAFDAFGNGTTGVDELQKDYEIRVTGEYEDLAADNVHRVKEGTGSMATLYGARGYDIANHPLNPNPGSSTPFLLRIPFEVWNIDDNQQVNLLVYHRIGTPDDSPFYSFNPTGRMYCFVNNIPYAPEVVNSGDAANADTDNLTWNWIFWSSNLNTGDVVNINYANPLGIGVDKFSFNSFTLTSIDEDKLPNEYSLSQNYPNPFNPSTTIQYTLPVSDAINTAATTKIIIYDILGREVVTLVNKVQKAGRYEVQFDASNFSSGVYIYRLQSGSFVKSRKMLLIK